MADMAAYSDADGYEAYMGHWSLALAPLFLKFAALDRPARILDVGCGTGSLLRSAKALYPAAALVGIDPSASLLDSANRSGGLAGAKLLEGTAAALPFGDDAFDCCLSLLVLQEFSGLGELTEMRRVTGPGGVVAACQWDFAKMPVIAAVTNGVALIDGPKVDGPATGLLDRIGHEDDLCAAWAAAGYRDNSCRRIMVTYRYRDFDQLWESLLGASTPGTSRLAALNESERDRVRRHVRQTLRPQPGETAIQLTAEALAVRGFA